MTVADVVNGLNETGLFQHAWDCIEELLRRETTYTAISMPTYYQEAMEASLQNVDDYFQTLFDEAVDSSHKQSRLATRMYSTHVECTQRSISKKFSS
jgi:hypothetical protein